MRLLLISILFVTVPLARAQELPDSGLPDASVGEGGADHTGEENDPDGVCLDAKDCAQGFTCSEGRCVPLQTQQVGCTSVPLLSVVGLGALGLWFHRKKRLRS